MKLIADVGTRHECLEITHVLNEIDNEEKADPVLMASVRLALAYGLTMEWVAMIIDMYETSRIFNSFTLAMPIDTPDKTKVNIEGNRTLHRRKKMKLQLHLKSRSRFPNLLDLPSNLRTSPRLLRPVKRVVGLL